MNNSANENLQGMNSPSVLLLRAMYAPLSQWWQVHVLQTIDHQAALQRVTEDDRWTPRYAFMTLMSAGIAVLGLLLSSPAVVIGAMLISPLMGPIVGLGFALAMTDAAKIRTSASALGAGALIAVLFTALIVMLSPLQTLTPEIAARTRPNLFDLVIALFSALAGTYAMIRGRAGTIVGVAIATALMPPLATVGYGLATMNSAVFTGALLLFITNLVTIALAAAIMARLYGFGRALSPSQTWLQSAFIIVMFLCLAIPLGLALRQIAWETNAQRQANDIIVSQFPSGSRISELNVDFNAEPITVGASILTKTYRPDAEQVTQRTLSRVLGRQATVTLEQIKVSGGTDTQAAQIAAAQAKQQADANAVDRLSDRLQLISGAPASAITIDRVNKRAIVRAANLPDAGLGAYRELERRTKETMPGWDIRIIPPILPLPSIEIDAEGKATSEGLEALTLGRWAAWRRGAPISVSGPEEARDALIIRLQEQEIEAAPGSLPTSPHMLKLSWSIPTLSQ